MSRINACVDRLEPFFEQVLEGNWHLAEEQHTAIMQLEATADELKKQIRLHLPNSLFMPVARTDVLGLLTAQDKIASKAKHISGLVLGRRMTIPDMIQNQYMTFVRRCIDASRQANKAINELDELVETGFKGREVRVVEDMIFELDQVERDTDKLQVEVRQQLFQAEKSFDPVNIIFLYKVIDWTGELADRAQHVGHRLESMVAH